MRGDRTVVYDLVPVVTNDIVQQEDAVNHVATAPINQEVAAETPCASCPPEARVRGGGAVTVCGVCPQLALLAEAERCGWPRLRVRGLVVRGGEVAWRQLTTLAGPEAVARLARALAAARVAARPRFGR